MGQKKKNDLETVMSSLEETVAKMESRDTGLNESIKLYEKAASLAAEAKELLAEYKGRITVISDAMNSIEEDFE